MNLADMLTYADIGILTQIAKHYECSCNANSKLELIQSILGKMGRREYMEEHLDQIEIEDLRFLNTLLFDGRREFSLEELVACARQANFSEEDKQREKPRELISRFRQRGWLFNGTTSHNRYLFHLPDDLKSRFRTKLEHHVRSEVEKAQAPEIYREEPTLAAEDLSLFLEYVQRHDIPLNSEGAMYRRNQAQLMEKLHVEEPLLGKSGWRFGYGRSFNIYPDRLSLLYDYAYNKKWIIAQNGSLEITASGAQMIAEDRREPLMQLIRFWLRLYRGPIPNLLSLIYWIDRGSTEWVTVSSLYQSLEKFIKPFYYDTSVAIFQERILKMMLHLGMLRIGEDNFQNRLVRMTPIGRAYVDTLCSEKPGQAN